MGLWEDAKNIRDKDPAARNVAEVIILYPGFHVLVTIFWNLNFHPSYSRSKALIKIVIHIIDRSMHNFMNRRIFLDVLHQPYKVDTCVLSIAIHQIARIISKIFAC